jgi:hypothetical protein
MGKRSDIKPLPSLARLNALFSYEPETGDLRWKSLPKNFHRAKVGELVGTIGQKGYLVVGIDRKYYLVHRVIWKLMTGEDPVDQIDHEDTNRRNNRWRNLRPTENGPNIQNSRLRRDNASGVKGVSWEASRSKWRASITVSGKLVRLGRFSNIADAEKAALAARSELHGSFARAA